MQTIEERLSFLEQLLKPTTTPDPDPSVVAIEPRTGMKPLRVQMPLSVARERGLAIEGRK